MTKITLQTVVQYEYDTETQRTRVLKNYTTPIGEGSKAKKKVVRQATISDSGVMEL